MLLSEMDTKPSRREKKYNKSINKKYTISKN